MTTPLIPDLARGTPLRGRDPELDRITEGLRALRSGRSSITVVSGPPGAGKSRILAETLRRADAMRLRSVVVAGDRDERFLAGGSLLRGLRDGTDALLDAATLLAVATRPEHRYWLLEEIRNGIERAALRAPLLVVVDDLQWCDDFTLVALRALPQRLGPYAVMWLFATRPAGGTPAVPETLARLSSLGAARIELDGLGDDAVAAMAADILGATAPPGVLAMARAAGNRPLLVAELMHGLAQESGSDGLPVRFRDSILRRTARLSPAARTAIEVASLLSREISVGRLAALLRVPPADLLRPLAEALAEDLLQERDGQLVFRHDLVRDAVRESVPAPLRRTLRREAAGLALRDGAPVVEVASLLADSAERGDLEAITALRSAAAELAASSPSAAADLSRRALELCHAGSPQRAAIAAEGIRLLWLAGRGHEASTSGQALLLAGLDPVTEAGVRMGIAAVSSQYSFAEAVAQCRAAVALPGLPADLRVPLLALLAVNLTMYGDIPAADAVIDQAAAAATGDEAAAAATGDEAAAAVRVATRSVVALYRDRWDEAFALADRAVAVSRAAGADGALWGATQWRGLLDAAAGRPDLAIAHADRGVRAAQAGGQAWLLRQWTLDRCRLLYDAGRLEDARSEAEGVLAMADELGAGNYADCTALMTLARIAVHTGDPRAARAYAADARRMLDDPAPIVRRTGRWLAVLVAADDGDDRALAALLALIEILPAGAGPSLGTPLDPADEVTFVRLALRTGHPDRAVRALEAARARSDANPGHPFLGAVTLHARGLVERDAGALRTAAGIFATFPRPLPYAACLEDLAELQRAHGVREDVVRCLDRALAVLEEAGASRDAARVRRALRDLGARRGRTAVAGQDPWASLTVTETAVVRRVAEGSTNREVAAAMFLSPHTVGTHLRHAFTKLGINSRVELTRLLLAAPPTTDAGPAVRADRAARSASPRRAAG
ncbi:AAA family ATPase [Actinoplanes sp. NPDC051494]|uniref:helix-turn-helix transcriptional regulator n=1 Tax=Actinoplanes sp. NPDC051494 TaxID=3363907 RepID=UPI00379067F5